METKKYAILFKDFEFLSKEHLDIFLQNMDKNISTHCLIGAVKTAYERGAYTIGEVELISRAIRELAKEQNEDKSSDELVE